MTAHSLANKPEFEARAFADEVVLFIEGSPAANAKPNNAATLVLGKNNAHHPSLTLGCGGVLIIRFVDNALIDVAGDDLYVFEVGPNIEATKVEISNNARDWIYVGEVAGSTASLDIHDYTEAQQSFSYVRLTDLKQSCQSTTPGADIDAIAAIGSAERYQFSGDVLFDFDQRTLKAEAKYILQQWADHFHGTQGRLQINGHTDQKGKAAYNLILSKKRAQTVAQFLHKKINTRIVIETRGLGESQLITSDMSQAAKNRRVEIIYFIH